MTSTEISNAFVENLFSRIPTSVAETFTDDQLKALELAFARSEHSVDIRRSVSLFGKGYYFILLVMGRERRPEGRRRADRAAFPLLKLGNVIVFALLGAMVIYTIVTILGTFGRLAGG